MRRALAALAVLAAAAPAARAGSHCHEVSSVVGYEHCRRFAWWSHALGVAWDFGGGMLRYTPPGPLVDGTAARAATATGGAIDAPVVRMASRFLFGHHASLGAQIDFGWFDHARLVSGGTAVTSGTIAQVEALLGVRHALGPLTFIEELGPGERSVYGPPPAMPPPRGARALPIDSAFVLDVHEQVDAWISPNVSIAVMGAVDVVQPRDVSVGVMLGLHLAPFDATR